MSQRTRERRSLLPDLGVELVSTATALTIPLSGDRELHGWVVEHRLHDERLSSLGHSDLLHEETLWCPARDELWQSHHALCRSLEAAGQRCRQPSLHVPRPESMHSLEADSV